MEPIEKYAELQPLVKKEFDALFQAQNKNRQYEVAKIPAHSHNGSDSIPVTFSDLQNVNFHSIISTTTLTSAQIKALNTTPIQLVPQPGLRAVIIVDSITARLVYGGTAYTGANNLEFRYTDGAGTKVTADMPAAFINSTANAFYHAPEVTTAFAPIEGGSGNNGRIVVSVPVANPATGNSTISFTVHYRLVSYRA